MGLFDKLFGKKSVAKKKVETVESRAQRLREEAKKAAFPARGPPAVTSGQVGAACGVEEVDDRALELIESGIGARQSGNFDRALSLYEQAVDLEPLAVN